ncbi:NUDIX hydrolase [Streptomyces fradiae]|uniref:NUDIX hydrolase n=1 Tax=Streptomyces fradiae TaxID=1906 RepID=UPI003F4D3D84
MDDPRGARPGSVPGGAARGDASLVGVPAGAVCAEGPEADASAVGVAGGLPPGGLRRVARVVLLDPDDRILLMHGHEPDDPALSWWFTPGGGVEGDETREEAALRELAEETGITDAELGPVVWRRICSFPFDGRRWNQDEWYYLARTRHRTAALGERLTDLEVRSVAGLRWWTSAELSAARETVYPTRLAGLLRRLLDEGPPPAPVVLSPEIV